MQHFTVTAETKKQSAAYPKAVVNHNGTQKIFLFIGILACLVAAVNL